MNAAVRTLAVGSASLAAVLAGSMAPALAANPAPGRRPAFQPTDGFPPAPTPFTVRIAVAGRTECLNRSPDATLNLRPCDPRDAGQRWVQQTLDGEGYGLVYDPAGDCIVDRDGHAVTEPAHDCEAAAHGGADSWKQLPDGTVAAAEPTPGQDLSDYWKVEAGRSGGATFRITSGPYQAGEFAMVPLPTAPTASPTPSAGPTPTG